MFIGQTAPVSFGSTISAAPPPPAPKFNSGPATFHDVEAIGPITDGENQVPSGANGTVIGMSLDEVEVQFYSPKDVLAFAQKSDVQSG